MSGSPGLSCRTERVEVVFVAFAVAWVAVEKGVTPRILRYTVTLEVGAVPVHRAGGTGNQTLEALLRSWVAADVELVHVEHSAKALDRLMRDLLLGGAKLVEDRRCDQADQQPKDRENDKKLKQRETGLFALTMWARSSPADGKHHGTTPGQFPPGGERRWGRGSIIKKEAMSIKKEAVSARAKLALGRKAGRLSASKKIEA
jgi:hypothetical protein